MLWVSGNITQVLPWLNHYLVIARGQLNSDDVRSREQTQPSS